MKNHSGITIPEEVSAITDTLQKAGFEAYLIGGCVRDLLLGNKPKDWDVTTNARPEEIVASFEHTFYENDFGTVGVVNENTEDETLKTIEVTTYRLEADYRDKRRPSYVNFSDKLEDDLKRRDFTINAIAVSLPIGERSIHKGQIVDLYKGQEDLKKGIIRTVGSAKDRFDEDALRILRAVRLSAELSFTISKETSEAIAKKVHSLSHISKERIRDEFVKILMSKNPAPTLALCQRLGILKEVLPDLERGMGVEQNQAHKYDVWEHNLRSMQHAADKNWPLAIRMAALLHDISKPETRRWSEEKRDWTFHGHDVVGGRIAKKILTNLKFQKKFVDDVSTLVRWHMFFSDPEQITLSAVRRTVKNVGEENIRNLMSLRICDRIGTGRPKEEPYRFRKYQSMIEEAVRDPISVSMLKIDGNRLIEILGAKPGPKIGHILHALLEEVLDNPKLNSEEYLEKRAAEFFRLKDEELENAGKMGRTKKEEKDEAEVKKIRGKYFVE